MYDDLTSFEHKPIPNILQKPQQIWKIPNIYQKPQISVKRYEMHD